MTYKKNKKIEEIARKVQKCLSELGIRAEVDLSEHDGVVHARTEVEGRSLTVVAHVTDRQAKSENARPVSYEAARSRLQAAVIRPTLGVQPAGGVAGRPEGLSEPVFRPTERVD